MNGSICKIEPTLTYLFQFIANASPLLLLMLKRSVVPHIFIFFLLFFFKGTNAFAQIASGLHNPVLGASALAQGNAFAARADDASAIGFNPAGLTQLERPEVSSGASVLFSSVEYHNTDISEEMETINIVPNVYFASPIVKNKLAAGIGVTAPYGLDGEWDDDGFSRFVVTDFSLKVINVNPTLTFKPFSFLSFGAGFSYYYADVELGKHVNTGLINSVLTGFPLNYDTPEAIQDLDMHGDAFGYNVGVLYKINPRHSIGISFRSKADIDFEGKLRLSNLSGASASLFGSHKFVSKTSTTVTLPEMLSFGYAYRHKSLWSIEADVQWTNWSRFDILKSHFRPTNPLLESSKEDVRKWHNTLGFALGGEYKFNETIRMRGGYAFHESPVPGETFEPSVPQSSRHSLFAGIGYSWGKNLNKWIDFAYGVVFYEDIKIDNPVGDTVQGPIDGHYDHIVHIVAMNFNYRF